MFDQLLGVDELARNTRRQRDDPRITVTPVGSSRSGSRIDMLSLGDGDRDVLVVGVPHPNEPAGAITVERMITLLVEDESARRGFRWHFIKAIDPDGLRLTEGWLKARTLSQYLHNFFRPALHRQPETTFPLVLAESTFSASTPENLAWQHAFELTRPCLHASLHHCDYGGVFHSLSRALPKALPGLQDAAKEAGLGLLEHETDVMDAEQWAPAIHRYPSAAELAARGKERGVSWAYPWEYGEMSPGYGEANFGTLTLVAEAPLWDAATLHQQTSSGVTIDGQRAMLNLIAANATVVARRHIDALSHLVVEPDELECLWALQRGLRMIPSTETMPPPVAGDGNRLLSMHEFELRHTEHALFALRTYGLLFRLASLLDTRAPGTGSVMAAQQEAHLSIEKELAIIEARTTFVQVPLSTVTRFQMQSIFACAEAL